MSEHQEQKALFHWAKLNEHRIPELALLFAIPNGGLRDKVTAAKMKAEGTKAGVPDVCLPVPSKVWHGLYIEMKTKKGRVSREQVTWIHRLIQHGYQVKVCRGWQAAAQVIEHYLGGNQ